MKNVFKISILLFLSFGMLISCSKKDDDVQILDPQDDDDPINQPDPPIILDCNYFLEDRVLKKNPKAKVDYIITCIMRSKGEIVIEPGVVIEFQQGATGIAVFEAGANSSFRAIGTPDKPIIFRGVKKEMGYWTGLRFASTNNKNELKHVIVEDAGNDMVYGKNFSGGVHLDAHGQLKMTNTKISNCKNYGLNIYNEYLNITLGNNIYTKNEIPLVFRPRYLDKLDSQSSYSGNINDHVNMNSYGSSLSGQQNITWRKLDVPYKLVDSYDLVVHVDVKIEAGVEVIMTATRAIIVSSTGTLRMNGTAQDKIIFRGVNDVPAYWKHIYYFSTRGTLNKMSHVEIRNAGKSVTNPQSDPNGALLVRECYLNIDNITFTNCFDFAINTYGTMNFTYSNLILNNTPRLFGSWNNEE